MKIKNKPIYFFYNINYNVRKNQKNRKKQNKLEKKRKYYKNEEIQNKKNN